jgi:hypothetical protein
MKIMSRILGLREWALFAEVCADGLQVIVSCDRDCGYIVSS